MQTTEAVETVVSHDFVTSSEFASALADLEAAFGGPLPRRLRLQRNVGGSGWSRGEEGSKTALKQSVKLLDRAPVPGRFRLAAERTPKTPETPAKASGPEEQVCLWQILVPTRTNPDEDGRSRPIRVRQHRVWDNKVKKITGGLTITPPVKGIWVDESDEDRTEYRERMIPVNIACTRSQIMEICKMTAKEYDQIEVLAYQISTDTLFYNRADDSFH